MTEECGHTKLNIGGKRNIRDCIIINRRQTHSVNRNLTSLGPTWDKLYTTLARMSKFDFHNLIQIEVHDSCKRSLKKNQGIEGSRLLLRRSCMSMAKMARGYASTIAHHYNVKSRSRLFHAL